jgi:tetratricopeptide (TPR) repeat protein
LLNQWEQAIPKLQKALEMKRVIYNEKTVEGVAVTCHLLATALFELEEYEKALLYFQEALAYFQVSTLAGRETQCVLNIALCYKGLKNLDGALNQFRKVEELCVRKSVSDQMRLEIHQTMADTYSEEEYAERSNVLYHLEEAKTILERMRRSENDEETLIEIQAKILSLEIA